MCVCDVCDVCVCVHVYVWVCEYNYFALQLLVDLAITRL